MYSINELDVNELRQRMDGGEGVTLIDVRSPQEAAQASIPGSINIPLHTLPVRMNEIPEDDFVVLYCRSGARSAQACAFVGAQGRKGVYNLRGGIIAWAQAGQAVA
jgi:rhodanese-related sulfurtransferase